MIPLKKVFSVFLTLVLCCSIICTATATIVDTCADAEFSSASASLSAKKTVTFSCLTNSEKKSIKITSCWLQKKDGTIWRFSKSLALPTVVASNTNTYGAWMDYSSSIGSGTYRIGFIANADGHTVTRYSNERTY